MKTKFNVASLKLATKAEGPFTRCCIWFQGCNVHCTGCCNLDLQPLIPVHVLTEDELFDIVMMAKKQYNIEGITLSGGEPSLQKGLVSFNYRIREAGLGIIMFSGYYREDLPSDLVQSVDLLIDGPYINEENDKDRFLIGSKNKKLSLITERYKDYIEYFNNVDTPGEITISENAIFFNGD